MKTSIKTALLSVASWLACAGSGHAQTMVGTVTQPCNNNGVISVTVTGLTPPINYTYTNWMTGSTVHSGIATSTDALTGIGAYQTPWGGGNVWQVTASSGANSVSQSFTINPSISFADSVYTANCPAQNTVQAFPSGGTAPYTCVWTEQTSMMSYTGNPLPVPNGQYGLTIIDAAGCMVTTPTFSGSIYVMSNSSITGTITGTAANCTNGTATVNATGGTAPYTYLWSNGAVTQALSGLSQGYITCTITDAVGCQRVLGYYVQQAVNINFNTTITNATCLQTNGGIMSFVNGGTAPYTYLWSNGATTANLSGIQGGQAYTVLITDVNGCTRTGYTYVGVTTPISVTYSTTASSCTAATGGATITATGGTPPYSIIWYTFPSTTSGASISSKPVGNYSFKVTDANGCIQTGMAYIPPVSTINASMNGANVVCPANTGNISVSVTGSNPPFTYAWNTGATTSAITGATLGSYYCTITDAVGCVVNKSGNVWQTSPISVGFSVTPASCIYATDGTVTAVPMGGTAPYNYLWSTGSTAATAGGLGTGYYYVSITDANGCNNNGSNQVFVGYNPANNACYCTITGTVYTDANSNCVRNAGENGIPNVQIHCSGLGYTYTDANGVYSFMAPTGTYTVSEAVQQMYPLAPCQTNSQVVSVTAATNCATTVNFANNVTILHDLRIFNVNMNLPIPGNSYTQKVIVQNDGSAVESTEQFGYVHDGQLGLTSYAPWSLTQPNAGTFPDWYRITSGFPTLNPGAASSCFINYNVPANIPLSTAINFNDTISWNSPMSSSWLTDNTPWNNVSNHVAYTIGSYDPNFKEVTPQGTGPQGNIATKDSILTYVIHFQNTGTYYAQKIVVIDTLDSDLKLTSMRPGYSDHNYTASMSETGVVKFTFDNINLPWKAQYGDVLSSGMVTYSVKLKNNLPMGTQIKNKAAIYFDYNEPIITNTTLNTLASTAVGVNELGIDASLVALYPNPATNYFTLAVNSPKNSSGLLRVLDISGREIMSKNVDLQAGQNALTENTSYLAGGIYFVQLKADGVQVSKKLIIAK